MKLLKKVLNEANGSVPLIVDKTLNNENKRLNIPEAITLGFFEDMVKKVESLIFLIENEQDTSIDLVARGIMEDYVYLKFLLSSDNVLNARSYFLANKYKEIKFYESIISTQKVGVKIRELLGESIEDFKKIGDYKTPEEEIESLNNNFSDVLEKRKMNQKWYNLNGKTKNFQQLCEKYELHAEYELMYTTLSKEVHSMDVMKRWYIEGESAQLVNGIRDKDFHQHMAGLFLLETLRDLYEFYGLKNELKKFNTLIRINYTISKRLWKN